MSLLALARKLFLAEAPARREAERDPVVAMALEIFPGATVVALRQPMEWPPKGATLARPPCFDPFAVTMPASACRVCGMERWFRAGDGWTCATCHPPVTEKEMQDG